MDELHRSADKFHRESTILIEMLDVEDVSREHAELLLFQAKRVRREANILVRAIARERDELQP